LGSLIGQILAGVRASDTRRQRWDPADRFAWPARRAPDAHAGFLDGVLAQEEGDDRILERAVVVVPDRGGLVGLAQLALTTGLQLDAVLSFGDDPFGHVVRSDEVDAPSIFDQLCDVSSRHGPRAPDLGVAPLAQLHALRS
jgi:hypothetical protein